jgi:hypothetical protein
MKRLLAIGFIWGCCAMAWMVLGGTIVHRSGESSSAMREEVRLLWGPAIVQAPPSARYERALAEAALSEAATAPTPDAPQEEGVAVRVPDDTASADVAPPAVVALTPAQQAQQESEKFVSVPVDGSDIDVSLALEQRRKGLMWFSTYAIDFSGRYDFVNSTDVARELDMRFPLAPGSTVYDAFKVVDADGKPVDADVANGQAVWRKRFEPGEKASFTVVYKSRGTGSWTYGLSGAAAKVKNFKLSLAVDDLRIDFPAGTLSPSSHTLDGGAWRGEWAFDSLVSSAPIGVELPQKLNPGPLASRITFFAPVSLLFFFFVVAILAAARRKNIHPMNYFMLGCAFFAFHLLFAYLVDHLAVAPAFGIAAAASTALVISYTRLFVGWRFALLEVGISQLLYLVLFSFSFFFKGFTGLSVTIGAVITLFVIMQITGRVDWAAAGRRMKNDDAPPPQPPRPAAPPAAPMYGPAPAE